MGKAEGERADNGRGKRGGSDEMSWRRAGKGEREERGEIRVIYEEGRRRLEKTTNTTTVILLVER